ncbi:hypothetical protein ACCE15_19150 [Pseudomonas parafulva]|uniref:hypothetical protein n=1 Tax=Pseudomonas parafulva TaxID=157782 RepID=UPI003565ABB1
MKWILKTIALIAVLATANVANASDKVSMCDVAEQAQQGMKIDYDISEIDMFVICNKDIRMNLLVKSDRDAFVNNYGKWLLAVFGYTKDAPDNFFSMKDIFDIAILPMAIGLMVVGAILRTLYSLLLIAMASREKDSHAQEKAINRLMVDIVLFLISALALFLNPYVRASASVALTVVQNAVSNTTEYSMAMELRESKQMDIADVADVIAQLEPSSQNLFRNIMVEENTKYLCLTRNVVNLSRSDYSSLFDTSSTVGEVFNNFQFNVKYVSEDVIKNGVVYKRFYNWNTDFPDYFDDKYCYQSLGFDVVNDAFPTSLSMYDNDEVAQNIIVKAEKDSSIFMTSGKFLQLLSQYEEEALSAIKGNTLKTALRKPDSLTNETKEAMKKGMEEVEKILIESKVDTSLYGHYLNAYINEFTSASKGMQNNPSLENAKVDYVRRFALYAKTWNCSPNYKMDIGSRMAISKINALGAGANFTKIFDYIPQVNWQCATLNNGSVVYTGSEGQEKIDSYANKALSMAMAVKMFDSRLGEGARRGARAFVPQNDKLENDILALALKGAGALGQAGIPYRKFSDIKSKRIAAINNSLTINLVGGVNEQYVDEQMIFGPEKDTKSRDEDPTYKNFLATIKPVYLESLISEEKGTFNVSYESAKVKEKSNGFWEIAKSFMENSFDYNENMKENLGMNPNLSYEAGYNECKNSNACDNRFSGTLSDIVVNGGQDIFSANAKFYIAIKLLEAAKLVGNLGSVLDLGYEGGNVITKGLSKVLSIFGKGAAIIVTILHALVGWMEPIVKFAMVAGFIAGWIIPMMEPVMSLMHVFTDAIALWLAGAVFVYRVIKAVFTGSYYHWLDAGKSYVGVIVVGAFTVFGMAFVHWATKSLTVGHELRPLLGFTSDVFLVGNILGTLAINMVALVIYTHILTWPAKAGAIGEKITHSEMNMGDIANQNDKIKGAVEGWLGRMVYASNPVDGLNNSLKGSLKAKKDEMAQKNSESSRAGKENDKPKPRGTEAI